MRAIQNGIVAVWCPAGISMAWMAAWLGWLGVIWIQLNHPEESISVCQRNTWINRNLIPSIPVFPYLFISQALIPWIFESIEYCWYGRQGFSMCCWCWYSYWYWETSSRSDIGSDSYLQQRFQVSTPIPMRSLLSNVAVRVIRYLVH